MFISEIIYIKEHKNRISKLMLGKENNLIKNKTFIKGCLFVGNCLIVPPKFIIFEGKKKKVSI